MNMREKNKYFVFIILLWLTHTLSLYCQIKSGNNLNYYPFNIGNKWIYNETITGWDIPPSTIYRNWKLEILKDTILNNGKEYRQLLKSVYGSSVNNELIYEQIDTLNQKVYRFDLTSDSTNYERIVLDFTMAVNDTIYSSNWMITCMNKDSIDYFNKKYSSFEYSHIYGLVGYGDRYLKNIGLYKYTYAADFFSSESILKGCVIDSVLYGDSTLTSIFNEPNNHPNDFIIYQNYPNPFNNTTIISFYLTCKEKIILNIYDNLGREVKNLVNKELSAGFQRIEFDATGLASGVYYYKVYSNKYFGVKKFILLK